jgi:small subunit ribosomal protein S17
MSGETMENSETAIAESENGAGSSSETAPRRRRTEKVGIVTSDKMMKTVVVRVDRLVKHPIYKRYVRKRSKFMAHSEIEGVSIGDQVRIIETRPLSARKRWRVVEVLRKASK